MLQYTFEAASRKRSSVLANLPEDTLTLLVPFERKHVEAWDHESPATDLSDCLRIAQVPATIFLAQSHFHNSVA